jgi:hypothetical protein
MIPVKRFVDVHMKRTLYDKVDKASFEKHLEALIYLL